MNLVKMLIEFIVSFTIIWCIYYFFIIRRCKKNKDYIPVEVNLILLLYKIDYRKIQLYKMIKLVSVVTALILSLIITIISNFFNNMIIVLITGTIVSVLIAIIFYNMIGNYFKNKSINKKNK